MRFSLVLLMFIGTIAGCDDRDIQNPPRPELKATYTKLIATYDQIGMTARRIAENQVSLAKLPGLLDQMCRQQCDASHLRCIAQSMKSQFPDMDARPPKEFPVEIPPCEGPECDPPSGGALTAAACSAGRDSCLKRCDCLGSQ
jgi:hypothetical protein